jgi:hypothetical protein
MRRARVTNHEFVQSNECEPEWVVVPDVVANAPATLALAAEWVPRLRKMGCLVTVDDLAGFIDGGAGLNG